MCLGARSLQSLKIPDVALSITQKPVGSEPRPLWNGVQHLKLKLSKWFWHTWALRTAALEHGQPGIELGAWYVTGNIITVTVISGREPLTSNQNLQFFLSWGLQPRGMTVLAEEGTWGRTWNLKFPARSVWQSGCKAPEYFYKINLVTSI